MSRSRRYPPLNRRGLLGAALAAMLGAPFPALAHHGWSWAEGEQIELKGTIQKIVMAPPHPTLTVKADDGVVWRIELANPSQTERSGFTANSAKPGDSIIILGNRDKDRSQAHMKAVRITINGKKYDIYPERIGTQ
jgi:Family of unknown function (DUF6152)